MKITLTSDTVERYEKIKRDANKDCDTCPCCGEDKSIWYYSSLLKDGGVEHSYIIKKRMFRKPLRIDMYHCTTCGTKWESNPYRFLKSRSKFGWE